MYVKAENLQFIKFVSKISNCSKHGLLGVEEDCFYVFSITENRLSTVLCKIL